MRIGNLVQRHINRARMVITDVGGRYWNRSTSGVHGKQTSENTPAEVCATPVTAQHENGESQPVMVEAGKFFNNLKTELPPMSKPRRIFRFVAIPKGTLKGQPGTVHFLYGKLLKCGSPLKGCDGRTYLIVERKSTAITVPPAHVLEGIRP